MKKKCVGKCRYRNEGNKPHRHRLTPWSVVGTMSEAEERVCLGCGKEQTRWIKTKELIEKLSDF